MQNKLIIFLCNFLLVIASEAQTQLVFKDVNVITMSSEKVLAHHDVVIENGLIKSIHPNSKTTYNSKVLVINASGKYLMPGLADMHVHLPRKEQYGYGLDQFLKLNLAAGVTTLRSMRGDNADPELQRAIKEGKKLSPDLYISAPAFSARYWIRSDSLARLVHGYKAAGFQLLKVLSIPSITWFDTLAMIAQQEHIKLAGHAPAGVPLVQAFKKGLDCVEHLGGYEALAIQGSDFAETLQQTVANNVYNCPTLDWYFINYTQIPLDSLRRREGIDWMPPAIVKNWDQTIESYLTKQMQKHPDSLRKEQASEKRYIDHKLEVLKRLYQNKCQLLISPDASAAFQIPGLSLLEEMEHYKASGIPIFAVLKAATANAAAYFGEADKWGTVETGKRANLILLNKNPLKDVNNLRNPAGVMIGKRWLPATQLNKLVETCKQHYYD